MHHSNFNLERQKAFARTWKMSPTHPKPRRTQDCQNMKNESYSSKTQEAARLQEREEWVLLTQNPRGSAEEPAASTPSRGPSGSWPQTRRSGRSPASSCDCTCRLQSWWRCRQKCRRGWKQGQPESGTPDPDRWSPTRTQECHLNFWLPGNWKLKNRGMGIQSLEIQWVTTVTPEKKNVSIKK